MDASQHSRVQKIVKAVVHKLQNKNILLRLREIISECMLSQIYQLFLERSTNDEDYSEVFNACDFY